MTRSRVTARGEAVRAKVTGIASFADVKSLGKASIAVFDLEAARTLFAKDGYDRILVAGQRAEARRARPRGAQRGRRRPVRVRPRWTR